MRKGAPWLKTALVTAAWAALRVKASYLQTWFHRLRARRRPKKAILAVASSMLAAACHMLKYGVEYKELCPSHFYSPHREKMILRPVWRIDRISGRLEDSVMVDA